MVRFGSPRESGAVAAQRARRDALHLLADGLCAVCRERDDAARRWLAYFASDSNADEGVRARVRAAAGFCPAHTRRLLADTAGSWLLPRVHAEALAGGRALLGAGGDPGPCPACEAGEAAAERALTDVLRALGEPRVREALAGGAVCLPHTAALAVRSTPQDGAVLIETASARLAGDGDGAGAGDALVAWLAGLDGDAPPRARHQRRLEEVLAAEESAQRVAVSQRWEADVRLACCPLCLAGHRAARRLLRWAAATTGSGHPTSEETELCPRHLHDLEAVGGPNVPALLADNAASWRGRLARFTTGRAGRRNAGSAQPLTAGRCRACEEERTASSRQAALLVAALHDRVHARAYEQAHGVCLYHARGWEGPLPPLVDQVLQARLAWLEWEVTEALRKQNWHARHEVKGAEMAIGRRGVTLLDGRVYAGLPAPAPRASEADEVVTTAT